MKHLALIVVAFFITFTGYSQCTGIHFEIQEELEGTYDGFDLTGYTVYRVYADFESESNIIHSLTTPGGVTDLEYMGPIEISSSGTIFHHPLGEMLGSQINETLSVTEGFTSVLLDSYITINMEFNTDPGQLIFIDASIVQDDFDEDGYTMTEGTFSSVYGSANTFVQNQRALIAQITCTGVPSMCTYIHHAITPEDGYVHSYFCANGELGCHLPQAANFNPEAGIEDNSLCLDWGCSNEAACNYQNEGIIPDETVCVYPECGILNACNYSAEAACFDNSLCEYATTYPVVGSVSVVTGPETYEFSYPETAGSTYVWEVSGGTIISGQGSSSIEVIFNETGTHLVSVQETQENGCMANASVFQVQVSQSVGIDKMDMAGFTVYPNPCNDVLTINFAQPSGNLMVYDMQGKLLIQKQLVDLNTQLDMSQLESGIYLLFCTNAVNQVHKQVVVRR